MPFKRFRRNRIMEVVTMVNRFVLNALSYHGKGAIQEIPGLVKAKGLKSATLDL